MRAFIALDLPDAFREALGRLQDDIRVGRVVPVDDLHLTLAFLGDVPLPVLEELHLDLETLSTGPVILRMTGIDTFGGAEPRQIHAAIAPEPALLHLQRKMQTLSRRAGIAIPHRRFVPHVTLARHPSRLAPEDHARIGRYLAAHGDRTVAPALSDSVTLYSSTLTPDGPRYDALETYALA